MTSGKDQPLPHTLTLATRRSPLALKQTQLVRKHLQKALPEHEFMLMKIVTSGDKHKKWSLPQEGGKGLFTKELEDALLAGVAHLAVHSAKDLPTELPPGLALAGYLPRESANDVLVVRAGVREPKFIATSSPRRRAQLKRMYPSAVWSEIRGNVETRLAKIAKGQADATVMAAAGLKRLGIDAFEGLRFQPLPVDQVVPAAGQAAIGVECPEKMVATWAPLLDGPTGRAVTIERRFLGLLGGGCHTAVGAHVCGGKLRAFHENTGNHTFDLAGVMNGDVDEPALAALLEKAAAQVAGEVSAEGASDS